MALRSSLKLDKSTWTFNHASLKDVLRDLGIEFSDGASDLVMKCFLSERCEGHNKKTLYLNCLERNGIYHCFRCHARGYIDNLVRARTGWSPFKVGRFLAEHQAYFDPNDTVERSYETIHADENLLDSFRYRHDYCYDRKLTEETLRRFDIGYDRTENAIVFPWIASDGTLAAIKQRMILTKFYRFMPTDNFRATVFGIQLIQPHSIIWITEGEFDAMWIDQCLRMNNIEGQGAVALGGKVLQQKVYNELFSPTPSLIVDALDNDDEGRDASKEMRSELRRYISTYRMEYEDGIKDPNDCDEEHIVQQARKADECRLTLQH